MTTGKDSQNPFPGLRPFESHETHLFFGRDGQREELLKNLKRARFLAVVGTSGSGKSSLVRAGLLPALHGGLMASAGSGWRIALLRPGSDPIGNMAQALMAPDILGSKHDQDIQIAIAETILRRSSRGLIEIANRARRGLDNDGQPLFPDHENLLVVVDQFEELFRVRNRSESDYHEDKAAFVKLLLEATRRKEDKIFVVLTMRSDFLGDCSQFWDLPEAINKGQYLIPRMTRDERREAITGPVAVGRGEITEPLVNQLLNEVGDNPDQLPILQHALMRTWDYWRECRKNGEPIDIDHYRVIGTMETALSKHADEAYDELSDSGKKIAERLFKCLTSKEADDKEVRHPMNLGKICTVLRVGADEVKSVIDTFRKPGRSFLMPPHEIPLTEESLIDISHESLIRNWKRLKKWADEEADSARQYVRLVETALLYEANKENLLQDLALQEALNWRKENDPNEAWAERYHPSYKKAIKFLDDSKANREEKIAQEQKKQKEQADRDRQALENAQALAAERERAAEFERQRAEQQQLLAQAERQRAETQAKSARRLRWLSAAFALLFILAAGIAVYALTQRKAALTQGQAALAAQETAQAATREAEKSRDDAEKSAIQAREAEKIADTERKNALKRAEEAENQRLAAEAAQRKAESEGLRAENMKKVGELYRDGFNLFTSNEPDALEKAEEMFKSVASLYGEMNDVAAQASTYVLAGNLFNLFEKKDYYTNDAKPEQSPASKFYKEALKRLDNDWNAKASTLISIGKIYDRLDNEEEATDYFDRAIDLYDKNDPDRKYSAISKIAEYFHTTLKEPYSAAPYYDKMLEILRARGDRETERSLLKSLIKASAENNFPEGKDIEYKKGLVELLDDTDDFDDKVTTLVELGDYLCGNDSTAFFDADEEELKKGMPFYSKALSLLDARGKHIEGADVRKKLAAMYARFKENQKAIDYYTQAANTYHNLQNDAESQGMKEEFQDKEFESLFLIAEIHVSSDKAQEAEEYSDKALKIYRDAGRTEKELEALKDIVLVFDEAKKTEPSIKYVARKAEIHRGRNEPELEVQEHIDIAGKYIKLKKGDLAQKHFDLAASVHRNHADVVKTLIEIGKKCFDLKDKERASQFFNRAVMVSARREDQVDVSLEIAQIYRAWNEEQEADVYNRRAVQIYLSAGDKTRAAGTLIKIGNAYESFDFSIPDRSILKAIDYYTQALDLFREAGNNYAEEGHTLIKIAGAYKELDRQRGLEFYRQAIETLELALTALKPEADSRRLAQAIYDLATAYDDLGDRQKALDNYNRALPLLIELKDTQREMKAHYRIQALTEELKPRQ